MVTRKVDRLSCVRFGSARYSVPVAADRHPGPAAGGPDRSLAILAGPGEGELVAEHLLVAPGEASIHDDHYGGPRPAPRRAVRPKTVAEKAFCALGPTAEAFITGAAAAGNTRLGPELAELNTLAAAHGEQAFLDALARAVAFGRWRAADVRSILAAGAGHTAAHHGRGRPRARAAPGPDPPPVRLRPRRHHPSTGSPTRDRRHRTTPRSGGPRERRPRRRWRPTWPTGCAGSSWPRCANSPRNCCAPRRPSGGHPRSCCAPWSRPRSPPATPPTPAPGSRPRRSRWSRPSTSSTAPCPRSTRPPSTTSPAWNGSPPGRTSAWSDPPAPARATCSSRSASPPCNAGHRVRYFTAAELVETLYRGLADNSVGRVIDTLLRNDLIICDEVGFAPLDDTGAQLLFRFIAAAYERRALGIASHWPFESWGRFLALLTDPWVG